MRLQLLVNMPMRRWRAPPDDGVSALPDGSCRQRTVVSVIAGGKERLLGCSLPLAEPPRVWIADRFSCVQNEETFHTPGQRPYNPADQDEYADSNLNC
jgi:hypothetical protein